MLAEHQIHAVERAVAIIDRSGGALLADEPGLGKSFIAAELARREPGSVEVIVPASLVAQWNETLRRFGVAANILTHDGIVSDTMIPDASRRLIIVDEAHAFRNPKTQRYDALVRRSVGARILLVTATPLCNSPRDLRALLDVIAADDALADSGVPSIDLAFDLDDREAIAEIVSELVIRRDRAVLPVELQFGSLEPRVIRYDVFDASALIDNLQFPLVGETHILKQFLWRRLESSEEALLESLRRQRRFYERALECLRSGRALPKREYRRAFANEEDADAIQQVLFWEMFVDSDAEVDAQEIEAEVMRIDELRMALASAPRTKLRFLLDAIGDEPAVIFTGWTATARAIFDAIAKRKALATGRDRRRATDAIHAFQSGYVDVLVATDLVAEGLNLQRAGTIVHYDLPWNPVKIDQRNGRALRIGQTRESVVAIYFLANGDRSRVMNIVARKNEMRRRLLPPSGRLSQVARLHGAMDPRDPRPATSERRTLRPRVTRDAAIVGFGPDRLPPAAAKRHRAGVERLLATMSAEYLDDRKLRDLTDLLEFEPL